MPFSRMQRAAVAQALAWLRDGQRLDRCPPNLRGPIRMLIRMGKITEEHLPTGVTLIYPASAEPVDLSRFPDESEQVAASVKATRCKACGAPVIAARNVATGRWHYLTPTPVPGGTLELWMEPGKPPTYRIVHSMPRGYDPEKPILYSHHTTVCRQQTLFDG